MNDIDSRGVKRGRCDCENCDQFEWTFGCKSFNCNYWGSLPVKHTKLDDVQIPALQVSNALEVISLDEPTVDEPMYLDINTIPIITPNQLCSNSVNEEQGVERIASNFELQNSNVYLAREDVDDSVSNVSDSKSSNEKHVYETESHLNQSASASSSDLSKNNTNVIKETVLECLVPRNLPDNIKRLIKAGAQLKEREKSVIIRLTCKNMLSYNMTNFRQISKMSKILCLNFPFLEGPYGLKHLSNYG